MISKPKAGSKTARVFELLHRQGPLSVEALTSRIEGLTKGGLWGMAARHGLVSENGAYNLPITLRIFYDSEAAKTAPVGDIVPPRRINVLNCKPLQGYGDTLRSACKREGAELRDISFLSAATAINVVR